MKTADPNQYEKLSQRPPISSMVRTCVSLTRKSPLIFAPDDVDLAEAELAKGTSPFHKVRILKSSVLDLAGSVS
jgi:hypothetical protein